MDNAEIQRFEDQYFLNPDSLVFARLADAYRKAGDPQRALEILESGTSRHPDYQSAHIVRARTCIDLGRPGAAEEAFVRVLELDSANLVALRGLAALARDRGDQAGVQQWLQRISGLDSTAPDYAAEGPDPEPASSADPNDPDDRVDTTDGRPVSNVEPLPQTQEESWTPDKASPSPGEEREDVEPAAGGKDEAWWFEDPSTREPTEDGDLLTRTMAQLYEKQGLDEEAAAIYRELLTDRPDDEGLREALAGLETRLPAVAPVVPDSDESIAVTPAVAVPGDERTHGGERAGAAPAPPNSGKSEMFLEWLRRLGE